ncbi:MAG: alpha/beta hydrolase [Acidobacteriota bacterium]
MSPMQSFFASLAMGAVLLTAPALEAGEATDIKADGAGFEDVQDPAADLLASPWLDVSALAKASPWIDSPGASPWVDGDEKANPWLDGDGEKANPWLDGDEDRGDSDGGKANPWLDGDGAGDPDGDPDRDAHSDEKILDRVYTLSHDIPFAPGQTLRVHEFFTLRSWLTFPRRSAMLVSSFYASGWNIPVDGYRAGEMLAREGFFAFSVDLVGYADSFAPANGNDATFDVQLEALRAALRYIRFFRWVPKVDIIGEGYGASLATQLAEDARRVRSVVLTDNLYRIQIGGPASDPVFRELIENDPDGYIFIPPEVVSLFLAESPPEVASYFAATQSGFLPAASFTVAFELPFYDPSVARVAGLVIQSENDLVSPPSDAAELAADYGLGGAEFQILNGVGRGARFGSPDGAADYWQKVMDFLKQ